MPTDVFFQIRTQGEVPFRVCNARKFGFELDSVRPRVKVRGEHKGHSLVCLERIIPSRARLVHEGNSRS